MLIDSCKMEPAGVLPQDENDVLGPAPKKSDLPAIVRSPLKEVSNRTFSDVSLNGSVNLGDKTIVEAGRDDSSTCGSKSETESPASSTPSRLDTTTDDYESADEGPFSPTRAVDLSMLASQLQTLSLGTPAKSVSGQSGVVFPFSPLNENVFVSSPGKDDTSFEKTVVESPISQDGSPHNTSSPEIVRDVDSEQAEVGNAEVAQEQVFKVPDGIPLRHRFSVDILSSACQSDDSFCSAASTFWSPAHDHNVTILKSPEELSPSHSSESQPVSEKAPTQSDLKHPVSNFIVNANNLSPFATEIQYISDEDLDVSLAPIPVHIGQITTTDHRTEVHSGITASNHAEDSAVQVRDSHDAGSSGKDRCAESLDSICANGVLNKSNPESVPSPIGDSVATPESMKEVKKFVGCAESTSQLPGSDPSADGIPFQDNDNESVLSPIGDSLAPSESMEEVQKSEDCAEFTSKLPRSDPSTDEIPVQDNNTKSISSPIGGAVAPPESLEEVQKSEDGSESTAHLPGSDLSADGIPFQDRATESVLSPIGDSVAPSESKEGVQKSADCVESTSKLPRSDPSTDEIPIQDNNTKSVSSPIGDSVAPPESLEQVQKSEDGAESTAQLPGSDPSADGIPFQDNDTESVLSPIGDSVAPSKSMEAVQTSEDFAESTSKLSRSDPSTDEILVRDNNTKSVASLIGGALAPPESLEEVQKSEDGAESTAQLPGSDPSADGIPLQDNDTESVLSPIGDSIAPSKSMEEVQKSEDFAESTSKLPRSDPSTDEIKIRDGNNTKSVASPIGGTLAPPESLEEVQKSEDGAEPTAQLPGSEPSVKEIPCHDDNIKSFSPTNDDSAYPVSIEEVQKSEDGSDPSTDGIPFQDNDIEFVLSPISDSVNPSESMDEVQKSVDCAESTSQLSRSDPFTDEIPSQDNNTRSVSSPIGDSVAPSESMEEVQKSEDCAKSTSKLSRSDPSTDEIPIQGNNTKSVSSLISGAVAPPESLEEVQKSEDGAESTAQLPGSDLSADGNLFQDHNTKFVSSQFSGSAAPTKSLEQVQKSEDCAESTSKLPRSDPTTDEIPIQDNNTKSVSSPISGSVAPLESPEEVQKSEDGAKSTVQLPVSDPSVEDVPCQDSSTVSTLPTIRDSVAPLESMKEMKKSDDCSESSSQLPEEVPPKPELLSSDLDIITHTFSSIELNHEGIVDPYTNNAEEVLSPPIPKETDHPEFIHQSVVLAPNYVEQATSSTMSLSSFGSSEVHVNKEGDGKEALNVSCPIKVDADVSQSNAVSAVQICDFNDPRSAGMDLGAVSMDSTRAEAESSNYPVQVDFAKGISMGESFVVMKNDRQLPKEETISGGTDCINVDFSHLTGSVQETPCQDLTSESMNFFSSPESAADQNASGDKGEATNLDQSPSSDRAMNKSYKDLSKILATCSKQEQELGGQKFDFSCIQAEAAKIAIDIGHANEAKLPGRPNTQPMMQSSLSVETNNSEAGPVTADEDFNKEEFFQNVTDLDFECLARAGSTKLLPSKLARQSLYVKFDPLVGKIVASTEHSDSSLITAMADNHQTSGEEGKLNITPPSHSESDERIINFTPTPARKENLQVGGGYTPILRQEISKLQELMIQQEQAHQEKTDLVEQLRSKIAKLEMENTAEHGDTRTLEQQLKSKDEELKWLQEELEKSKVSNKQLVQVMEEYEKTISQLVTVKEETKAQMEKDKETIAAERDTALQHLSNMEVAFNDIHQKYERAKTVIETLHANEKELKKSYDAVVETVEAQNTAYQKLKQHAAEKLSAANAEIEKIHKEYHGEMARMKAVAKKNELKCKSLEESMEQKKKELRELTQICDELIANHTPS